MAYGAKPGVPYYKLEALKDADGNKTDEKVAKLINENLANIFGSPHVGGDLWDSAAKNSTSKVTQDQLKTAIDENQITKAVKEKTGRTAKSTCE